MHSVRFKSKLWSLVARVQLPAVLLTGHVVPVTSVVSAATDIRVLVKQALCKALSSVQHVLSA